MIQLIIKEILIRHHTTMETADWRRGDELVGSVTGAERGKVVLVYKMYKE
jgi:hypothetical protein